MRVRRRFILCNSSLVSFLSSLGLEFATFNILEIALSYQVSYLKVDNAFFKIDSSSRQEIGFDEFNSASNKPYVKPIKKQRHSFMLDANFCHIDIYDELDGLCMLEIEFANDIDGVYFALPDFLSSFVLKEVSDNKFFSPFGLSLFGYFDYKNFNFSLTLKRILTTGVVPYAPPSLNISKSVLSLLFSLILPLRHLNYSNIEQNYKSLLSSASLLKAFANTAFDERIALLFSQKLEKISDPLANMIYTKGLLLYSNKHSKNKKKQSKNSKSRQLFILLEKALTSQILALDELNLKDELREYEIFLSDDDGFYAGKNSNQYTSIAASKALRACLAGFVRMLNRLDEKSPNSLFFAASNFSSSSLCIVHNFSHCWGELDVANLIKIDKILDKLRHNQAWHGILLRSNYQPRHIQNKLLARMQKLRMRALELVSPSKEEAFKNIQSLKIYKR